MKCSNCGNELTEDAKFCNSCGTLVNNSQVSEQIQQVEKKNTNKSNKSLIILVVVIIIIIGGIGGVFLINNFDKNKKLEDKTEEKSGTKNKDGKVKILEEDGDYKKYLLSLENFEVNNKYDFKLNNNHVITLEIIPDDVDVAWNMLVDGNKVFEDWTSLSSGVPLELEAYTLGDYVILNNIGFTYYKAQSIYVINKDGKLAKEIFNVGEDEALISYGMETDPNNYGINTTGITIKADRRGDTDESACSKKERDFSECDVVLCDRDSWPEGFNENTIYKATIKYEYKDGILDLNEKILESETVGEFINKNKDSEFFCKEGNY